MDDILTISDDNLGGLSLIKIAPFRFFSSLSPVTFAAGCDWISLECITESMLYNEQHIDDVNGGYIQLDITAKLPMIRPDAQAILEKYRFQQLIVLCQDNNGYNRLCGRIDSSATGGLILVPAATTGTAVADSNGYAIQLSGQLKCSPLFL